MSVFDTAGLIEGLTDYVWGLKKSNFFEANDTYWENTICLGSLKDFIFVCCGTKTTSDRSSKMNYSALSNLLNMLSSSY